MSLECIVNRFKCFSTVLNWVHKHIEELDRLNVPLYSILLSESRFLFCNETTELVKVLNKYTGKFKYCVKYISGIMTFALKLAYYLYDHRNHSKEVEVVEKFFRKFFGRITPTVIMFVSYLTLIAKYYSVMAHVRHRFVNALKTDHRSTEAVHLISKLC